jgi:hypothetical protein
LIFQLFIYNSLQMMTMFSYPHLLRECNIDKSCIAGCDYSMQKKMLRDASQRSGFDETKHFGVDIGNTTTEQAVDPITDLMKNGQINIKLLNKGGNNEP